jgi:hypothetical protein
MQYVTGGGDFGGVVEHFGGVFSLVCGEPALLRLEAILAQFGELHFPGSLGGGLQSEVTNELVSAVRNE